MGTICRCGRAAEKFINGVFYCGNCLPAEPAVEEVPTSAPEPVDVVEKTVDEVEAINVPAPPGTQLDEVITKDADEIVMENEIPEINLEDD